MSENKIMTQSDIDSVKPDESGVRHFGNGCEFGDGCKFGNRCVFQLNCKFGLSPAFGNRCCFCAPMDYLEYVERTNRETHTDAHNALMLEGGEK